MRFSPKSMSEMDILYTFCIQGGALFNDVYKVKTMLLDVCEIACLYIIVTFYNGVNMVSMSF